MLWSGGRDWAVNPKRVNWLICEERLQLRNKTPKRKDSAKLRQNRGPALAPHEVWGAVEHQGWLTGLLRRIIEGLE